MRILRKNTPWTDLRVGQPNMSPCRRGPKSKTIYPSRQNYGRRVCTRLPPLRHGWGGSSARGWGILFVYPSNWSPLQFYWSEILVRLYLSQILVDSTCLKCEYDSACLKYNHLWRRECLPVPSAVGESVLRSAESRAVNHLLTHRA